MENSGEGGPDATKRKELFRLKVEKVPNVRVVHEIRDIYDGIKSGRIITNPDFQRRYWWDETLQSGLINTIICGRVVPEVFTYVYREKGYEEVVDGQQRLETIRRFIDGEFSLDRSAVEFKEVSGLVFSALPEEVQNKIMSYPISVCKIYSDEISDHAKIQMFVDLNPKRQGIGIKHQEVRNCIYRGKFNNFLKKLAEDKAFRIAFNIDEEHDRMLDVETALAFVASVYGKFKWWDQQKSLTNFMSFMSREVDAMGEDRRKFVFDDLKRKFKHGLQCSIGVFGNIAFCDRSTGRKRVFSRKYFLTFMNAFQDFDYPTIDMYKNTIKNRIDAWVRDDKNMWEGYYSRTISSSKYREEKMSQLLHEITGVPPKPEK